MRDLYNGTLGTLFDTREIIFKLTEYAINQTESLSYEFATDRTKIVIITGKNDEEKALPNWQHPIIYTNTRRETTVAIDMRPYMVSNLTDMITVREKLQDKYNGTLLLYRLVFTKLILDEDTTWFSHVKNELLESFSKIISTTVGMILYDKTITTPVEMVSKLHLLSVSFNDKDHRLKHIIEKLNREDINSMLHGENKELYRKLNKAADDNKLEIPSTTIGSLVDNIKVAVDNDRADGITEDVMIQSLSRSFYGIDSKTLSIAMVEDLPSLIAVLVMVITEGINSKSNIRKILDNSKRTTKPKELSKFLMDVYKGEIVGD